MRREKEGGERKGRRGKEGGEGRREEREGGRKGDGERKGNSDVLTLFYTLFKLLCLAQTLYKITASTKPGHS